MVQPTHFYARFCLTSFPHLKKITPPEKLPKSKYHLTASPSKQRVPLYAETDESSYLTPTGVRQVPFLPPPQNNTSNSCWPTQQIRQGKRKCRNLDVPYLPHGIGGRIEQELPRPIASWENPTVVRWIYRMARDYPIFAANVDPLRRALSYPTLIATFFVAVALWISWKVFLLLLL